MRVASIGDSVLSDARRPICSSADMVTGIGGYTQFQTPITYHPNGMIAAIRHANEVVWNQTNGTAGIPRPGSIFTSGGAGSGHWSAGDYLYDGSGNVKRAGSDTYVYDPASRILEWSR